jgi:hypothetical protein
MSPVTPLYEEDFYAWTQHQAALLRAEKWGELDSTNLAEELESLGRRDRRELGSRLQVLVMHLLKWRYQPEGRQHGQSWRQTIRTQRTEIQALLADSPSLRPTVSQILAQRYPDARVDALDETGLPDVTLPQACPWTPAQILDASFWPDA